MDLYEEQRVAVAMAGDVKQKLVDFATSALFARHLRKCRDQLVARGTIPLEEIGVEAVEMLLFEYEFDDGSTVIDRFIKKGRLNEAEQEMVLGFSDSVHGVFETLTDVPPFAPKFTVRCCFSELAHEVAPTLVGGIDDLPAGAFIVGRLTPIAGTDLWTPSGNSQVYPKSSRAAIAELVMDTALREPWRTHCNPEKYDQAIQQTQVLHQRFLDRHGSDWVSTDGENLPDIYAEAINWADDRRPKSGAAARSTARATIENSPLADAAQVTMFSHPIAGFGFYRDFSAVERALENGEKAHAEDTEILKAYLEDSDIPQWFLQEIILEHLPTSEAAIALTIGKTDFSWEHDGEHFLASYPGELEPVPSIAIAPALYTEQLTE